MTNWLCRIFGHKPHMRMENDVKADLDSWFEKLTMIECERCGVKLPEKGVKIYVN